MVAGLRDKIRSTFVVSVNVIDNYDFIVSVNVIENYDLLLEEVGGGEVDIADHVHPLTPRKL